MRSARKKLTEAARLLARGQLLISSEDEPEQSTQDDVEQAFAAFGLRPECSLDLEESYELWPENVESFKVWLAVQSQWHIVPGRGKTGLNYPGVEVCMRRHGLRGDRLNTMFSDVQRMEFAALSEWSRS